MKSYTAHVELYNGSYHAFIVTASNVQEAYKLAASRTGVMNTLQGVTEN